MVAGDIVGLTNVAIPKDGFYTVYSVGVERVGGTPGVSTPRKIVIRTVATGWEPLPEPPGIVL